MTTIKKYESALKKVLDSVSNNPLNPSSVNTLNRLTSGLANTGIETRLSQIDGNPEIAKLIDSKISQSNLELSTPTQKIVDLIDRLNNSNDIIDPIKTTIKPIESTSNKVKIPSVSKTDIPKSNISDPNSIGTTGTLIKAIAPTVFSLIDGKLTKDNINTFKDYGKDALNTLDESKMRLNTVATDRINNIIGASNVAKLDVDKNTRSLNVGRALKANLTALENKAISDVIVNNNAELIGLNNNKAQVQLQRDQTVMQAADIKNERDLQDLSSIISNFSASTNSLGSGLEHLQKIKNADSYNDNVLNIINSLLPSLSLTRDEKGNLTINKR